MASIDVAIPSYNYARFLPECVESVLSQDVDVRVIIIDNGSTDGSAEIARQLASRDRRVEIVLHETNLGPHASFNEAIDLATAEYFLILCADDLLAKGALRHAVRLLQQKPQASFALGANSDMWRGGDLPLHTGGGAVMGGTDFIARCCQSIGDKVPAHALFVRTVAQKAAGHYRPSLRYFDDLELAFRLAAIGDVAELPLPIAVPRIHSSNLSAPLWENRLLVLQERERVFESFFTHEGATMPDMTCLRRMAMRRIGEAAYWSALSHFARRRTTEGSELLRYAFSLNPGSRLLPPFGHLLRGGTAKRVAEIAAGSTRVTAKAGGNHR